jgi:hypothetical protein
VTPQELEALLEANAAALALPIAPGHRPGVLHYLALASSYAELVQAHPFGIDDDPAAVFVPVEPAYAAAGEADGEGKGGSSAP